MIAVAPCAARFFASWSSISAPAYRLIFRPQARSLAANTPRPAMRDVFTTSGYLAWSLALALALLPLGVRSGICRGNEPHSVGRRLCSLARREAARLEEPRTGACEPLTLLSRDLVPLVAKVLLQLLDLFCCFLFQFHELAAGGGIVRIAEIKYRQERTSTGVHLWRNVADARRARTGAGTHSHDGCILIHAASAALWNMLEVDRDILAPLVEQGHVQGPRHERQLRALIRGLCQRRGCQTKRRNGQDEASTPVVHRRSSLIGRDRPNNGDAQASVPCIDGCSARCRARRGSSRTAGAAPAAARGTPLPRRGGPPMPVRAKLGPARPRREASGRGAARAPQVPLGKRRSPQLTSLSPSGAGEPRSRPPRQ